MARCPYTQNSTTLQSQRKNENTSLASLPAMVSRGKGRELCVWRGTYE